MPTRQSPTDKSKAHLEGAYRDTHQLVYQEVDRQVCRDTHRQVYQEVLPTSQSTPRVNSTKSTKILLKPPTERATMKSTGWSPKRTSNDDWPSQAVSTSQCHLPMTTGCKIYSPEHAEALHRAQAARTRLNLVSITIFREAHLLDDNE